VPSASDQQGDVVLRNLAILAFIALPAGVVTLTLCEMFRSDGTHPTSVGDVFGVFLVALLPTLFGGAIHQLTVTKFLGSFSASSKRRAAVLLSPLVVGILVLMSDWDYVLRQWPALVIIVLVFAILVRQ
jgi:hypothetical protein